MKKRSKEYLPYISIFGIIALGLFLRLYHLGNWNLSADEAFSVSVAESSLIQIIKDCALDVHPPLYFLALHGWINIFGDSEFAVRSLSVLFGIESVIAIALLGSLFFNRTTGLLSAFLMSINSFHVRYSQNARMYSLLLFLSIVSIYLFWHLLKKSGAKTLKKYYYLLFIINVLLLYTHVYGILVVAAELLWLLVPYIKNQHRLALKKIAFSLVAAIVAFLPWMPVIIESKLERTMPWLAVPSLLGIGKLFSGNYALLIFFLPLFVTPILWKKLRNKEVMFLYFTIAITALLPLLVSILVFPSLQPRFIILSSAIFYLLIAFTITSLKSKIIKSVLVICITAASLFAVAGFYYSADNADWRSAAAYIDSEATPNDLLVFTAGYNLKYGFDYYSHRNDLNKMPFPALSERISIPVEEKDLIELDAPLSKNYDKIMIIYYAHKDIKNLLIPKIEASGYVFTTSNEMGGISVYEFARKPQR